MYVRVRKPKRFESRYEKGKEFCGHHNNKLARNNGQRQYITNGRGEVIKIIYHNCICYGNTWIEHGKINHSND